MIPNFHTKTLSLQCLLCLPRLFLAQVPLSREPGPDDFIAVELEPRPLNLDSVRAAAYLTIAKEAKIEGDPQSFDFR
jgi:hypothetical protein